MEVNYLKRLGRDLKSIKDQVLLFRDLIYAIKGARSENNDRLAEAFKARMYKLIEAIQGDFLKLVTTMRAIVKDL